MNNVGKYMYEILKFDTRPIATVWKLMRLRELKIELEKKISESDEKIKLYKEYFKVVQAIEEIIDFLYLRR